MSLFNHSFAAFVGELLVSWGKQLRHMFQEILIVGENHVVQGMVMAQEDASVILYMKLNVMSLICASR